MQTYSASFVAAALLVLSSATACGREPLPPTPIPEVVPSTLTLTGRVVDATMEDGSGVADAAVTASREGFSTSTMSGPDGSFAFPGLDAGEYLLSILREGYMEAVQVVQLDSDQDVTCYVDRKAVDENPMPERKGRFVIVKKGAQARR